MLSIITRYQQDGSLFYRQQDVSKYVNLKFDKETNEVRFHMWPLKCVVPNYYMETYLFDIANISPHRQQIHITELRTVNPDWFDKHWVFVVQMASAGRTVFLYSNQWYEYKFHEVHFVANRNTPTLREDGIFMTGDNDKLSHYSAHVFTHLFKRLIMDKDYLAEIERLKTNYEEMCDSLSAMAA